MNQPFKNRVALVTGGSRGIGYAIALKLLQGGAQVTITGCRKREQSPLEGAAYMACDFSDRTACVQLSESISQWSRLDILVNNAGINKIGPIESYAVADADRIWDVNVRAPLMLTQVACRLMVPQQYGRIVNITSIFGQVTKAQRVAYTSSKYGLLGQTKTTAVEMAPHHILVNAVAPGFVKTELTKRVLSEQEQAQLAEQVPMQRFAEPEEIANLVLFLASEQNTYMTGQNLIIDGGFTCV